MAKTIVAGPPLAGKTQYVREHASAGEVIYDFDKLHEALSSLPLYQHDAKIKPYVFAARDAIFALLVNRQQDNAWIITTIKRKSELQSLANQLKATVVVLMITREEAHKRCDTSGRPPEWHKYIDEWFNQSDYSESDFRVATKPESKLTRIFCQTVQPGKKVSEAPANRNQNANRKRMIEIEIKKSSLR